MTRIAFVSSGGGMCCAYGAGVAWALQDAGIRPNIFIGSSGSAGTVSYFACGQADIAARLWKEEVTNPQVLQRKPLRLDVDLIIDSMRDRFPLDEKRLRSESIELYLAATEYRTVRSYFFSNRDQAPWYEVMRASMATPFVYGKKVIIQGKQYVDGDVTTSLDREITLAKSRGATRIFVCDTSATPYSVSARAIGIRPLVSRDFLKCCIGLVKKWLDRTDTGGIDIVYLRPQTQLAVRALDNSQAAVEEAIHAGYEETKATL